MIQAILIGSFAIVASLGIAWAVMIGASWTIEAARPWLAKHPDIAARMMALVATAMWIQIGLSAVVWLWALIFSALGLFGDLEAAVYFALVCFTTLGFGDVLLDPPWRILSGMAAADGLLLFGLFTAFLVDTFRRLGAGGVNRSG